MPIENYLAFCTTVDAIATSLIVVKVLAVAWRQIISYLNNSSSCLYVC
ncbi:hypothetical protein [uncultured Nostoc sp.]